MACCLYTQLYEVKLFSIISLQPSGPNDSKCSELMYFHCLRLFLTNISRCIKEKKNFFCGLSSFVFTEVRHLPSGCARKSCCWWAGNDSLWAATRKASSRRPATCQNYHLVGQKLSERGFMHTLTLSHCCRRACPPPSLLPPRRSLHFDILPLRLE